MNYISIAQLNMDIKNMLKNIPHDIDIVVGIPRSGLLVANFISLYINKPITDIDSFVDGRIMKSGKTKNQKGLNLKFNEIKKVLICEDSCNSGNSINEAKAKLRKFNDKIKFVYLATYVTSNSKKNVDLYARIVEQPRVFEWNLMNSGFLHYACVDIDGVLCYDPTNEENDDGEKYINFIRNAKPKLIPTEKIKYLVTSRLEKYRKETEEWLSNNHIEYDELIMLDLSSAEERRKLNNHGEFKAEIFKSKKDACIFIESELKQSEIISNLSGKTCICVNDNSTFYITKKISLLKRIVKKIVPIEIKNKLRNYYYK